MVIKVSNIKLDWPGAHVKGGGAGRNFRELPVGTGSKFKGRSWNRELTLQMPHT